MYVYRKFIEFFSFFSSLVVKDLLKILPSENPIDIYSFGADSSNPSVQSDDKTIRLESRVAASSIEPVNYKGNFTGNF